MKLLFAIGCLLALAACHKDAEEEPFNPYEYVNGLNNHVIDFQISDESGNDLLWTKALSASDIEVYYLVDGKKTLYFREGVIAPWVHGYEIHRIRKGEEWMDNCVLRLYLDVPKSTSKPESITYLRLKHGQKWQEFAFKAKFDYYVGKGVHLNVLKAYLDGEPFWENTDREVPVLRVKD